MSPNNVPPIAMGSSFVQTIAVIVIATLFGYLRNNIIHQR
jgi:hypothetical protein